MDKEDNKSCEAQAPVVLRQRRIVIVPEEIRTLPSGTKIRIGIPANQAAVEARTPLAIIGFESPLQAGQSILPSQAGGAVSRRNANGHHIVHRDQPKELCHRQTEWCWNQWSGGGGSERVCKTVDVPYWRYPRTFVPPLCVEFIVSSNVAGEDLIVSPEMEVSTNDELLKHTINLFLEAFGTCQILHTDLAAVVYPQVHRLNWTILPEGHRPWAAIQKDLEPVINKASPKNRVLITSRLEQINRHRPEFVAVGRAGFTGYLVFAFPSRGLFVLESIYFGNATYALGSQWEQLSQLTKAEILNERLHLHRFVHRLGWNRHIDQLLQTSSPESGFALAA